MTIEEANEKNRLEVFSLVVKPSGSNLWYNAYRFLNRGCMMKNSKRFVINTSMFMMLLLVLIRQSVRILTMPLTVNPQKSFDLLFYLTIVIIVVTLIVLTYLIPLLVVFEISFNMPTIIRPISSIRINLNEVINYIEHKNRPLRAKLQVFRCWESFQLFQKTKITKGR